MTCSTAFSPCVPRWVSISLVMLSLPGALYGLSFLKAAFSSIIVRACVKPLRSLGAVPPSLCLRFRRIPSSIPGFASTMFVLAKCLFNSVAFFLPSVISVLFVLSGCRLCVSPLMLHRSLHALRPCVRRSSSLHTLLHLLALLCFVSSLTWAVSLL